jgi:hypothetical protein
MSRGRRETRGNLIFITRSGASCPTSGPYQYAYDAGNMLKTVGSYTYWYDSRRAAQT